MTNWYDKKKRFRAWIRISPEEMDEAARELAKAVLGGEGWAELEKVWNDVPEARDVWLRAARVCTSQLVVKLFHAERDRRSIVDHRFWVASSHFCRRNEDLEYVALGLMAALRSMRSSVRWAQRKGEMGDAAAERIAAQIDRALKKHSIKPEEQRTARLGALNLISEMGDSE